MMKDAGNPAVLMDIIRRHVESARRDPPEETRRNAILDWQNNRNRPEEWLCAGLVFKAWVADRGLAAEGALRVVRWVADAPLPELRPGRWLARFAETVEDWPAVVELVRCGLGLPHDVAPPYRSALIDGAVAALAEGNTGGLEPDEVQRVYAQIGAAGLVPGPAPLTCDWHDDCLLADAHARLKGRPFGTEHFRDNIHRLGRDRLQAELDAEVRRAALAVVEP